MKQTHTIKQSIFLDVYASNKPWVETGCLGENWFSKKKPNWRNFTQSGHTALKIEQNTISLNSSAKKLSDSITANIRLGRKDL
jgi:hypothetical protein